MSSNEVPTPSSGETTQPRQRIRDLFPRIRIGRYPTGPLNSITDVPEVYASTQSIRRPNTETSDAVNTGVTCIVPRKDWFENASRCGIFRFNGAGELSGSHWIEETGMLSSPIVLTNTFSVGDCYSGVYHWAIREQRKKGGSADWFILPVIGETYDGMTSDISAMAVTPEMVVKGLDEVTKDRVQEGCTGGGTGMLTAGFKSGTGSASRVIHGKVRIDGKESESRYIVGALVQSNYGTQYDLKFGGVPIGRLMMSEEERAAREVRLYEDEGGRSAPRPDERQSKDGSIIIVLATSAPLSAIQLQRLAKRATTGLARAGGWGSNSSGDIFIAFSTAHAIPTQRVEDDNPFDPIVNQTVHDLQDETINGLFECAADAVEESIYNALCGAEDTVGPKGEMFKAIDQQKLKELLEKYYV